MRGGGGLAVALPAPHSTPPSDRHPHPTLVRACAGCPAAATTTTTATTTAATTPECFCSHLAGLFPSVPAGCASAFVCTGVKGASLLAACPPGHTFDALTLQCCGDASQCGPSGKNSSPGGCAGHRRWPAPPPLRLGPWLSDRWACCCPPTSSRSPPPRSQAPPPSRPATSGPGQTGRRPPPWPPPPATASITSWPLRRRYAARPGALPAPHRCLLTHPLVPPPCHALPLQYNDGSGRMNPRWDYNTLSSAVSRPCPAPVLPPLLTAHSLHPPHPAPSHPLAGRGCCAARWRQALHAERGGLGRMVLL